MKVKCLVYRNTFHISFPPLKKKEAKNHNNNYDHSDREDDLAQDRL